MRFEIDLVGEDAIRAACCHYMRAQWNEDERAQDEWREWLSLAKGWEFRP